MVIAKTASRNVAFKAAKLGESAFAGQSDILIPEVATAGTFTHEEDLEDVVRLLYHWMVKIDTKACISFTKQARGQ